MPKSAICPYYGCDEDLCDVGCGYISSHDANMIIKFCSSQFACCHKYRELADRHTVPAGNPAAARPAAPVLPAPPQGSPAFGLFSFGFTVVLYALGQFPLFDFNTQLLGAALLLGCIGQLAAGLGAFKRNPLQAVAFTGFGLFWLSMLALDVLPMAGYGHVPEHLPMVGYLAMWGIFSLILCQGMESLTRVCRLTFALLTAFLMLLAIAHATDHVAAQHGAAMVGVICGVPGVIHGLRQFAREVSRWSHPELARPGKAR